jgi:hypothetical protein
MVIVVISLKSCRPMLAYDKSPLFVFQSPMYYMTCPARYIFKMPFYVYVMCINPIVRYMIDVVNQQTYTYI